MQGVEVTPVVAEQPRAPGQGRQLVEVEGEEEDPVREAVAPRREPRVHHLAFVQAGLHLRTSVGTTSAGSGRMRARGGSGKTQPGRGAGGKDAIVKSPGAAGLAARRPGIAAEEQFGHPDRAQQTVLVEAVALPGTGIVGLGRASGRGI